MSVGAGLERAGSSLLVLVHVALLAWALVGFAELCCPSVPWKRISNPLFSSWILMLQWSLVTVAASTYLIGFATRWPHTPVVMAVVYASMALVCAYQTLFILTNPTRFRAMAVEYVEYLLVLSFLFLSPAMRAHFKLDG